MILSSFAWLLVGGSILAQTINRLLTKYALFSVRPLPLTIFTNLFASVLVLPFVYRELPKLFELSTRHTLLLLSAGVVWGVFGYVYNAALEKASVSTFTIITQLQVVFVALLGFIFLNQNITFFLIIGITFICTASILATYNTKKTLELTPNTLMLCLATAVSGAIAVFLDSYNVRIFDIGIYAFAILFISNIPLFFIYRPNKKEFIGKSVALYFLVGIGFLAGYMIPLYLYSQPDVRIAYVYPLLRLGAILSVILGIVIFGEKANWKYKIIAILLACIGAVFIKLG